MKGISYEKTHPSERHVQYHIAIKILALDVLDLLAETRTLKTLFKQE